jgi:hypothetical protein
VRESPEARWLFSDHAALAPERRADLIQSVGELIDSEFGGTIVQPYCTELVLARRNG